jgi:hypothetical protein
MPLARVDSGGCHCREKREGEREERGAEYAKMS